ncbi:MAG: phosphoribosylanthranilate isomerase [Candidatus Competibacterales bacterium]
MTHRTRIKICGLTTPADAAAAAACGADAVGLVFYPQSPRAVDPQTAAAVVAALPPFVAAVGLFVDPQAPWVEAVLATVPLAVLQFHGHESPGLCRRFALPYIKAVPMGDGGEAPAAFAARYPDAQGLLLDSHGASGVGGTGKTFDWHRVTAFEKPVILAGGLHPANVTAALSQVRPFAVDVSSGVERARGRKDPARMAAFVAAVRRFDDRAQSPAPGEVVP